MNYLLIGRPNVGKSSIYNILTGSNLNIIHHEAGTTRDWHQEYIKDTTSYIFDTPGVLINENNKKNIINSVFNKIIINKINIFLYVLDYTNGYNEIDNFNINKLRTYNKEIILIINKFDNIKEKLSNDFFKYGVKDFFYISCAHRSGINELKLNIINSSINKSITINYDFSIAIFGKPNAGKSTFLNTILGYERSLTSSSAGTTSDFVVSDFIYKKKSFKVIDTAGIMKKANVKNKSISFYSIKKSFSNINTVDSAIILIDSLKGIDRQDKRIIKLISNKAKSIIIVFNKIDFIKNTNFFKNEIINKLDHSLREIKNIKIFFISALLKKDINIILNYLYKSILEIDYKISTNKLNQWLQNITKMNQHPLIQNKRINFKYAVQIKSKPVTIKIFCNYSNKLKDNYKKFLVNNFNHNFKILNQKTKFIFSSSKNPYV